MEYHEYANLFPMLPDAELQELANDIQTHGQWQPIIVHEGKILDGRNRFTACGIAGVEPKLMDFAGGDALSFVISSNLIRRHLTPMQKGLFASRAADMRLGANQYSEGASADAPISKTIDRAAKEFGVSTATLDRARSAEKTASPELVKAMESGAIGAKTAEVLASLPAARQAEVLAEGPAAVAAKAKEMRENGGAEIAPSPKPTNDGDQKTTRLVYRPSVGMEVSGRAIASLGRITDDDKELGPALQAVVDYCNKRLAPKTNNKPSNEP